MFKQKRISFIAQVLSYVALNLLEKVNWLLMVFKYVSRKQNQKKLENFPITKC